MFVTGELASIKLLIRDKHPKKYRCDISVEHLNIKDIEIDGCTLVTWYVWMQEFNGLAENQTSFVMFTICVFQ